MEKILEPTSIVGCSISLMFCLGAVVVLGCFREKRKPLLIKQQLSLSLVCIDIIILGGFQGVRNKEACRTVTTLLHYGVLSCFTWLFADQYYNFKSVVKNEPTCSFMKLCVLSWASPIPLISIQVAWGLLSSGKLGSKVYVCWNSDYIILTVAVPIFLLITSSFVMLTMTVRTLLDPSKLTSLTSQKELRGIKYTVKTSSVMILLSVIIWIFGFLLFWYPNNVNYQLVFALGHGLQGLFNFFFHCVFALEQNMYSTTGREHDGGELTEYLDERRPTKTSEVFTEVEVPSSRKPLKKMSRIHLRKEPEIPSMVEEETVRSGGSIIMNISDSSNFKDQSNSQSKRYITSQREGSMDGKDKGASNINHLVEKETQAEVQIKEDIPGQLTGEKSNGAQQLVADKGLRIETGGSSDNSQPSRRKKEDYNASKSEINRLEKPKLSKDENEPVNLSKLILSRNEMPPSVSSEVAQRNQAFKRRESANSAVSNASPCSRRTSRTSGSGQLGMNELESLFNNPDVMRQSGERRRSSSTSTATIKTQMQSDAKVQGDKVV